MYRVLVGLAVLVCGACPASAGDRAIPDLEVTIDYAVTGEDNAAFDALLAVLDANSRARLHLNLTLVPDPALQRAEDQRFLLSRYQGDDAPAGTAEYCGSGQHLGFIFNLQSRYELALRHPAHEHAIVDILVGDKLGFPDQTLVCLLDGYTQNDLTPLRLSGTFWVEKAEIPTAYYYLLTPVAD